MLFYASAGLGTSLLLAIWNLPNNLKGTKFRKWIMNRNRPRSLIRIAQEGKRPNYAGLLPWDAAREFNGCRAKMITVRTYIDFRLKEPSWQVRKGVWTRSQFVVNSTYRIKFPVVRFHCESTVSVRCRTPDVLQNFPCEYSVPLRTVASCPRG
jgi:hypothetical protein